MNIILLSKDTYLFMGLRFLFPGLLDMKQISGLSSDEERCIILIDSRTPLSTLRECCERLLMKNKRVSCISLSMTQLKYHPGTCQMKATLNDIYMEVIERLAQPVTIKKRFVKFSLEQSFKELLLLHLSGLSMRSISEQFACNEKAIYKYRNAVCKKMGYRNFIHACIHIFDNNLLYDTIELPVEWLNGEA